MGKEFLEAGKIVGTHGIRGELRVEPWCDSADFLTGFKTLYWNGGETPVKVLGARVHKSLVLMKLEGVESATQGDLLRGKVLYLARKDAKLPEGRYFIQDLIGMKVQDAETSAVYGKVQEVFQTGANDVYCVSGEDGKEILLPAIKDCILKVDLEKQEMLVHVLPGLLDL